MFSNFIVTDTLEGIVVSSAERVQKSMIYGEVVGLYVYPIKSCGGFELDEIVIDDFGPKWDRRWMIVDENGVFVSQRKTAQLARVTTKIQNRQLCIDVPDNATFYLDIDACEKAPIREVRVWNDYVFAGDCGDAIAQIFSNFLSKKVRLVFMQESRPRIREKEHKFTVSFADSRPLLMTNIASLRALNQLAKQPIPMDRFRANVVIDAEPPFIEETLQTFKIGAIDIIESVACDRCVITTIDQSSGKKSDAEPLTTLFAHFKKQDGKVYFGQRLVVGNHGVIKITDRVRT